MENQIQSEATLLQPRLVRLAAEASMRANQAESVAREAYRKDRDLCRYAIEEMKRERAESKRLFSEANTDSATSG